MGIIKIFPIKDIEGNILSDIKVYFEGTFIGHAPIDPTNPLTIPNLKTATYDLFFMREATREKTRLSVEVIEGKETKVEISW